MSKSRILGLAGTLLLIGGTFCPVLYVPFSGSLDYFQKGKGDGMIVLVLAGISLVLILFNALRGLLLTGILSLGVMTLTFLNVQNKIAALKSDIGKTLEGNPMREIADSTIGSIRYRWGWAVLLAGVILLFVAALTVRRRKKELPEKQPAEAEPEK